MSARHALSIDVEDWFQVLNMSGHIDRGAWDAFELRCVDSTKRLLDLLDRRQAKATFFFLGWVAERAPRLVHEAVAAGHEIGSHGYDHRVLHDLGRVGFAADLLRTNEVLAAVAGVRPSAFRACTWSVTRRTPWAATELLRAGFAVDSSIYPILHPDYGVRGAPACPYRLIDEAGELLEVPPLCYDFLRRRLPVGGGGYLRLLPLGLLRAGLRQQERQGHPGCIYLHPWEVDPEQPRQRLGWFKGFRHYVNLKKTLTKLDRLLTDFEFDSLAGVLADQQPAWRASLAAYRTADLLG